MHKATTLCLVATSVALICGQVSAKAVARHRPVSEGGLVLQEIVVTARRVHENLQKVPLSVTAITGTALQERGIRVPTELARDVPSLYTLAGDPAWGSGFAPSLRGMQGAVNLLTFSQPVAFYEDGVNIPHVPGNDSAFFDVRRVQVLAGPQGTLWGRNTTGGMIDVVTRGPEYGKTDGYLYAEGGNLGDYKFAGAVNFTLVPNKLAVRLAYQHWKREGFGRSIITQQRLGGDHNDDIARMTVRFDPNSAFNAQLVVEYTHLLQAGTLETIPQFANAGLAQVADEEYELEGLPYGPTLPSQLVNGNIYENSQGTRAFERLSAWHGVLKLNWKISDALSLTSTTGYHQFKDVRVYDDSALPIQAIVFGIGIGGVQPYSASYGVYTQPLRPDQQDTFRSQEFDLKGRFFGGRLSSQLGVYGSWDSGEENQTAVVLPAIASMTPPSQGGIGFPFVLSYVTPSTVTNTKAIYAQSNFHLIGHLSATLGARYTKEWVDDQTSGYLYSLIPGAGFYICFPTGTGPFADITNCSVHQSETSSGTSYLASLNWQLAPDELLYLKTSRGFRGGALNPRDATASPAKPEVATDYEMGLKSEFWHHRLRFNTAIYDTEYSNMQELFVVNDVIETQNAARSRIQGFEAQFAVAATENLSLYGSTSYTSGKFLKYLNASSDFVTNPGGIDASGEPFQIPKWKFDVGARYSRDIGGYTAGIAADYYWTGAIPTTQLNDAVATGWASASQQESWRTSIGLVNARVDLHLPDSGWTRGITIGASATNLLNKAYQRQGQSVIIAPGLGIGVDSITESPRMWWAWIRMTFGHDE